MVNHITMITRTYSSCIESVVFARWQQTWYSYHYPWVNL